MPLLCEVTVGTQRRIATSYCLHCFTGHRISHGFGLSWMNMGSAPDLDGPYVGIKARHIQD